MPEVVRKRAAQADALIEAQRQARVPGAGVPDAEAVSDPEQDPEAPTTDEGVQAVSEEPTESPDLAVVSKEDPSIWEQRWRSLDGQLRARDRQIEQLQSIIASMQAAPPPAPAAPVENTPAVSKEDEDNFGSDLVDMVRRASRSEAKQLLQDVMQRLDTLEQKLTGVESTATTTAHATFEQKLARLVPNWEKLNYDKGFIDWLKASPARERVFQTAATDMDVHTVAEFFLEYEKMTAKPTAPQTSRKEQLAKQVAPGKGRATPASPEPEHVIWTRTSIADFYRNKSKYSAAEFARLEKDLFNAQQQGRVDLTK